MNYNKSSFFFLMAGTVAIFVGTSMHVLADDVQRMKRKVVKITVHVDGTTKIWPGMGWFEMDAAFIVRPWRIPIMFGSWLLDRGADPNKVRLPFDSMTWFHLEVIQNLSPTFP